MEKQSFTLKNHSFFNPTRHCAAALAGITVLFFSGLFVACTYPELKKEETIQETVKKDEATGAKLAPQFEQNFHKKRDKKVEAYLTDLTKRLAHNVQDLGTNSFQVTLLDDRRLRWTNYNLPTSRVYLSVGLIRSINFENEIAAGIALELAHLRKRDVATQLSTAGKIDFSEADSVFAYTEKTQLGAIENAVDLLYQAGFDPRGLVTLFQIYQKNPTHSPYSEAMLVRFLEKTRRTLAAYTPLRNPVVRSQNFLLIRKRIQTL